MADPKNSNTELSPGGYFVLVVMKELMERFGSCPSAEDIAEKSGMELERVGQALDELLAGGYIGRAEH